MFAFWHTILNGTSCLSRIPSKKEWLCILLIQLCCELASILFGALWIIPKTIYYQHSLNNVCATGTILVILTLAEIYCIYAFTQRKEHGEDGYSSLFSKLN